MSLVGRLVYGEVGIFPLILRKVSSLKKRNKESSVLVSYGVDGYGQ